MSFSFGGTKNKRKATSTLKRGKSKNHVKMALRGKDSDEKGIFLFNFGLKGN